MPNTMKIELKFAGDAYTELANLQEKLHVENPAEVIRSALGVLRWAADHLEKNDTILAQDQEGNVVTVQFPFLLRPGQELSGQG